MKDIFRNISFFLMAAIVLCLSIGIHISKMKCAVDGQLYLGTTVPSCSLDTKVMCMDEQEEISCCMREIEKSCCPETKDETCASETENIHFDFETLVSNQMFSFTDISIDLSLFYSSCSTQTNQLVNNFQSGIPPPKPKQPILSQIQSFLL
jgi:hypothetical protein